MEHFLIKLFIISILLCMNKDYEALKNNLKALYPSEELTEAELNDMANRLIESFALIAKELYRQKKDKKHSTEK